MKFQTLIFVVSLFALSSGVFSQPAWLRKVHGGGLGNPFCINPRNDNIIYGSVGNNMLYISRDRGKTWQAMSAISGGSQIKSVAVSANDTNVILVAQEAGPPDRIMRTTNHGVTWYPTLTKEFYYWGVPLAYNPVIGNDTVYTMGSNTVWQSTNFGTTWDSMCANPFGSFNEGWEFAVHRPDSTNILIAADNATGIWKSTDHGVTWRRVHSNAGEVPALALTPGNPMVMYAALWAGGGGFLKSTDGGETWNYSTPLNTINMWGVSVSTRNPNYVITGTFGPSLQTTGGIYVSRDAGTTWERTYQDLFNAYNYACLVLDTSSVFVLQADGIWKYQYPPGSLALTSPNNDEIWKVNSVQNITWTSANVAHVRIGYTTNNGVSWDIIVSSVPVSPNSFSWTVPNTPSSQCRVRITDVADSSVTDESDSLFTILLSTTAVTRPNGGEIFYAGRREDITWTSVDVSRVLIQYTTDNGNRWIVIDSNVPADSSLYKWVVPHTPSTMCRIKVTDRDDALIYDVNDSSFKISDTSQFVGGLILSDNGGLSDTLQFGEVAGATDNIDPSFGEVELPPKPGVDTFDVRWSVPGTRGTRIDIRDTLGLTRPLCIYSVGIQPGPGGYPFVLRWKPESLALGDLFLVDVTTQGSSINTNMHEESLCVVTNPAITSLQIVHYYVTSLTVSMNNRWNIISLPLEAEDPRKAAVFPTAVSNAFKYHESYITEDSLKGGVGYWLKFTGEQTLLATGRPCLAETVSVYGGWNLIGSISQPFATTSISSVPPGVVTSQFFGYSGSYVSADSIQPGKGYWVKVNQNGKLILSTPTPSPLVSNTIRIVPGTELPPPPPEVDIKHRTYDIPLRFSLEQNFPNPFNPLTVIRYSLLVRSHVVLKVYDVLGREVATLVDEIQEAGFKAVEWDAVRVTSGVYFYRIIAGDFVRVRRAILIK